MTDKFKKKYKDKLQQALAECETGIQANAICEVVNVLIDYINYQERTIADVKEYIDEVENKYLKAELIPIFTNANLEEIITNLRSMLDELEEKPKANTSQWTQHYEICGYVCDNCGHISEIKDDVCSNCGARMDDKLEENKNE